MPVDAQINELYAWHGHITKLNGKNTIILMNDRTMYSLVFRNRLPRNVDKFAELIKEAIPYTMEVGGFNNLEIDKYMSGLGKIIFAEKADRQMTGNLTRMFLDMEYTCDRWQENESVQAEQAAFENNGIRRQTDDINTMHRYRDAIVYHNGADPYERTMFGAYVLFPYANKEEYRNHKFFESIEKVNIGGLPFLPSETSMVQDMLDALIADSPDSAFERATLPRGIEDKLAKIDWNQRDVLVGALRNRAQLDTCLKYKFYHIPASKIRDADLPIHYVAIYQSINIFGREAGIRYYGEVTKTSAVKRRDIREIPKNSDEAYYRFEIKEWKELNIPLVAKEVRDFPFFTNMFLLQHCPDVPDLHISSEEEYRLYIEVRRLANDASVNETDAEPGFKYDDKTIIMENGDIVVLKDGTKIEQISIETFMRKPRESMRVIAK